MSLTKEDKKDMVMIVNGTIEALVLPHFDEIENRLEKVEEDLSDVQSTVNRMEMLQRSELSRVDDHDRRIGKLEKAIS
jgi:hypothetical protein